MNIDQRSLSAHIYALPFRSSENLLSAWDSIESQIDLGIPDLSEKRTVIRTLRATRSLLKTRFAIEYSCFLGSDTISRFYIRPKWYLFCISAAAPVLSITCDCMPTAPQAIVLTVGTTVSLALFMSSWMSYVLDEDIGGFETPITAVIREIDTVLDRMQQEQEEV